MVIEKVVSVISPIVDMVKTIFMQGQKKAIGLRAGFY